MPIYVEGKLKSRWWEDKEGNRRRTVEVVAENFKILSRSYNQNNFNSNHTQEESDLDNFSNHEFSTDTDSTLSDLSVSNLESNGNNDVLPF